MKTWSLSLVLLLFLAAILMACGSSAPRTLQTVSISPATADARDFANGEVQFAATGYYNKSPMQVAPVHATWGACYQNHPTTDVTMTPGVKSSRPLSRSAVWLWSSCSHHRPTTYSGM